ncbi:variant erythrocyte surface antigen-1 family protein [Babesia caballi]|uniref:Variant erythrocyte surface antigen-1 family protein n=1 Tax=Babesia caballi TaxID=5871 RepID=A0AAV4LPF2_BABCB|nr:variant erythrocyte surface antigen-1 family protein [Babesia caballi]
MNNNEVNNALSRAVNKGEDEFSKAIAKVREVKESGNPKIPDIVSALKKVTYLTNQNNVNDFAAGVKTYLSDLLTAVSSHASNQVDSLQSSLPALVKAYGEQTDDFATQMQNVENEYKQLNHRSSSTIKDVLASAVYYGTESLLEQLKKDGYKSAYLRDNWDLQLNDKITQIFLGCLPLYYYWLTYLYWKCREKGGDWAGNRTNSGALSAFLSGQGYSREYLKKPGR